MAPRNKEFYYFLSSLSNTLLHCQNFWRDLNSSGRRRCPCLFSDHSGKALDLLSSIMLAIHVLVDIFLKLKTFPFISGLLRFYFNHEWMLCHQMISRHVLMFLFYPFDLIDNIN
jgi:hypothetical protein